MACCKCCCGEEDCTEGQAGKCCCGGIYGECCQEGEYCCSGVCQPNPCCEGACDGDEDCDVGCVCCDGECVPEGTCCGPCDEDADCAEGCVCVDGECVSEGVCCFKNVTNTYSFTFLGYSGTTSGYWAGPGYEYLQYYCTPGAVVCGATVGDGVFFRFFDGTDDWEGWDQGNANTYPCASQISLAGTYTLTNCTTSATSALTIT